MNSDHAESLRDYAIAFAKIDWAESVQIISMTVTGIELVCQSASGKKESVYVEFSKPLKRPEQVRGALVAMAKDARQKIEKRNG